MAKAIVTKETLAKEREAELKKLEELPREATQEQIVSVVNALVRRVRSDYKGNPKA